ncbi:MAG: hypothetical protein Fur006_64090 [Coleofasciculaceae cyanobacterium]
MSGDVVFSACDRKTKSSFEEVREGESVDAGKSRISERSLTLVRGSSIEGVTGLDNTSDSFICGRIVGDANSVNA